MEHWICPHCEKEIWGSLRVVLILASLHRCREAIQLQQTVCLECLQSPTGLCPRHTAQRLAELGS
jgi:hypothetical protein